VSGAELAGDGHGFTVHVAGEPWNEPGAGCPCSGWPPGPSGSGPDGIRSAPAADILRTFRSVMPPDTSTNALPRISETAFRTRAGDILSKRITSGGPLQGISHLRERLRFNGDLESGRRVLAGQEAGLGDADAPSLKQQQVIIFDQDAVAKGVPVVPSSPQSHGPFLQGTQARDGFSGLQNRRVTAADRLTNCLVRVAMPDRCWRKFKATRSAMRSERASPGPPARSVRS